MADYYPSAESQLVQWHATFSASLSSYSGTLGIVAAVVTQVGVDATNVANVLNLVAASEGYRSEAVAFKDQYLHGLLNTPNPPAPTVPTAFVVPIGSLANIEARTRALVAQIKANGAYTAQMGQDMGIVPTAGTLGTPEVFATVQPGKVILRGNRAGYPALALFRQIGTGAWVQIAVMTSATFEDLDPSTIPSQPEARNYRVQGYVNSQLTGSYSNIVAVVTVP